MSPGHTRSPEFGVNLRAVYMIEIAADSRTIPPETLHCLLGYKLLDSDCATTPSVVNASWVLSSGGEEIARGTSDTAGGGAYFENSIAREIGSFTGEAGCRYELEVRNIGDASVLNPAHPRLRVEASPYWTGLKAWGPAILAFFACLEFTGLVLLAIVGIKRWRKG